MDRLLPLLFGPFQQFLLAVCMASAVLREFPFQLDTLCYFSIVLSRQLKKKCEQFNVLPSLCFSWKWWLSGRFLVFVQYLLGASLFGFAYTYFKKPLLVSVRERIWSHHQDFYNIQHFIQTILWIKWSLSNQTESRYYPLPPCKATDPPQKQAAAVIKCKRTSPFTLLNSIQLQHFLKLKKKMTLQNVLYKFCCPWSLHSQSKGSKYFKKPDSYEISSSRFPLSDYKKGSQAYPWQVPTTAPIKCPNLSGCLHLSQESSNVFQCTVDR